MREFDVVVIGAGVGTGLAFRAAEAGMRTALVEEGEPGGTCMNYGCNPSKLLIAGADAVMEVEEDARLGVLARVGKVDADFLFARMRSVRLDQRGMLAASIAGQSNLTLLRGEARFVAPSTLMIGEEEVKGKTIFLVTGSRARDPNIPGLAQTGFLDHVSVLDLPSLPRSLVIVGGGYISCEYAHFFAAMGTAVTILQRNPRLLPGEEPEVSELLARRMGGRTTLHLGVEVLGAAPPGPHKKGTIISFRALSDGGDGGQARGKEQTVVAERVLVAAGRVPNSDRLDPARGGVELDGKGWIRVDPHLRTSRPGVWALGDVVGRGMFTHAGDKMAEIAWANAFGAPGEMKKMDFDLVPHAVFTWPQVASVGLTEDMARRRGGKVLLGKASYQDTAMGRAMGEKDGFAKAVVDGETRRILGFTIAGPHAPVLIQEVVNAMAAGGTVESITGAMHIYPALAELVPEALSRLA